jgi:ketosteroid isomerase-like protein
MAAQIRLRGTGPEEDRMEAWEVMLGIFHAWRDGRPRDMRPLLDDDVVMVLPGSGDRIEGAEAMLAGFEAFVSQAAIEHVDVTDRQVDVVGDQAIATYAYGITYRREGWRWRATGRDMWILSRRSGGWQAVWRTMLDLAEEALETEEQ